MFKYMVLIDDDVATNYYHKYIIKENEATESIIITDNVDDALVKLEKLEEESELHPSVLLLDISMPKYSGFELIQKNYNLFERLKRKGLNIVILTTSSNHHDVTTAQSIPIIDFIWQKSLTDEKLQLLKEKFIV